MPKTNEQLVQSWESLNKTELQEYKENLQTMQKQWDWVLKMLADDTNDQQLSIDKDLLFNGFTIDFLKTCGKYVDTFDHQELSNDTLYSMDWLRILLESSNVKTKHAKQLLEKTWLTRFCPHKNKDNSLQDLLSHPFFYAITKQTCELVTIYDLVPYIEHVLIKIQWALEKIQAIELHNKNTINMI